MLKVKLFSSNESIYVEERINAWLAENQNVTIVDIKISMAGGTSCIYSIYTIIYKTLTSDT